MGGCGPSHEKALEHKPLRDAETAQRYTYNDLFVSGNLECVSSLARKNGAEQFGERVRRHVGDDRSDGKR